MNRRLSELIRVYDDALPAEFCDRVVRGFNASTAAVSRDDVLRSFNELIIDGSPEWVEANLILERAKDHWLAQYCHDVPGWFPAEHDYEAFRIKRYRAAGNDQFRPHVDGYDRVSARRFLVCFWYLNDVEKGGETVFTRMDIKVRPRRGRVILFPPYWMYEHAGLAPRSGDKYIISTYFLFR